MPQRANSVSLGFRLSPSKLTCPQPQALTNSALRPRDAASMPCLQMREVGLGRAFLDQEFGRVRRVIDTNITGTVYLIHRIGNEMRQANSGRILITGSIAGFTPGSFQAVYNASKAFLDSFSFALREELRDTAVTVTCLMPGATETEFFKRADMMDTKVGTSEKDDAAEVAEAGFQAMMAGEGDVVTGMKNKLQTAVANVTPAGALARQHRKMAQPGTAKS